MSGDDRDVEENYLREGLQKMKGMNVKLLVGKRSLVRLGGGNVGRRQGCSFSRREWRLWWNG